MSRFCLVKSYGRHQDLVSIDDSDAFLLKREISPLDTPKEKKLLAKRERISSNMALQNFSGPMLTHVRAHFRAHQLIMGQRECLDLIFGMKSPARSEALEPV
jgi:hypothetical protein